jgi:hypothetical protein
MLTFLENIPVNDHSLAIVEKLFHDSTIFDSMLPLYMLIMLH